MLKQQHEELQQHELAAFARPESGAPTETTTRSSSSEMSRARSVGSLGVRVMFCVMLVCLSEVCVEKWTRERNPSRYRRARRRSANFVGRLTRRELPVVGNLRTHAALRELVGVECRAAEPAVRAE